MHGRHDHRDHAHAHPHPHAAAHRGAGGYDLIPIASRNAPGPAQWQTPSASHSAAATPEPDFDLVESAFAEAFPAASDPTSFLRLAGIPFEGCDAEGRTLRLLRVEYEQVTDVGGVTPRVGGGEMRYDPLPAGMVSRRRRLRFIYQRDAELVPLSLSDARTLASVSRGDGISAP